MRYNVRGLPSYLEDSNVWGYVFLVIRSLRICTSKLLRLTIAIAMSALPFYAPQESHAQVPSAVQSPVCDLQITTNIPGPLCVRQNIEFKVGDSNATIEQNKRAEEARKQREAQLAFNRAKNVALKPAVPVSTNVSGFSTATILYADPGQCVPFARELSGLPVYGTARNVPITSKEPEKGAVILTNESSAGHAEYVKDVQGDDLVLIGRNLKHGYVTIRTISKFAPFIRGYVNPS